MMDINFYVKSMKSFIILSVMWYGRLTKCYILHTNPSEFRELGKTYQATCFPLSTLNHWSFTEHTFWPSKPRLPKFPRWDSWAWIMSQKWDDVLWAWTMGFDEIILPWVLDHGLWHHFVNMDFFGLWNRFFKIHDSVDVMWVANEMKPRGVKNLFSTPSQHQ